MDNHPKNYIIEIPYRVFLLNKIKVGHFVKKKKLGITIPVANLWFSLRFLYSVDHLINIKACRLGVTAGRHNWL